MALLRSVLLVEDDQPSQDISGTILTHHGFQVTYARTVDEAKRCLREKLPDAVIVDLGLPETSGFELLRWIRGTETTRHLPVVVATVHVFPEDQERAAEAGCDVFLMKPLEPTRLARELEQLLASRGTAPEPAEASARANERPDG